MKYLIIFFAACALFISGCGGDKDTATQTNTPPPANNNNNKMDEVEDIFLKENNKPFNLSSFHISIDLRDPNIKEKPDSSSPVNVVTDFYEARKVGNVFVMVNAYDPAELEKIAKSDIVNTDVVVLKLNLYLSHLMTYQIKDNYILHNYKVIDWGQDGDEVAHVKVSLDRTLFGNRKEVERTALCRLRDGLWYIDPVSVN